MLLISSEKNNTITLTGTKRLQERPMEPLLNALKCLGLCIEESPNTLFKVTINNTS